MAFFNDAARRRYEQNLRSDLSAETDRDGVLNGQARGRLGELAFGRSLVARAGCEAIGVYNALVCLGIPRPLPEIIRDMELRGYMRAWGYMGATPWFSPLLRHYGARSRVVLPSHLRRDQELGLLRDGEVFLFSIWNDRRMPFKGLHTFAGMYEAREGGNWLIFNRFNEDKSARRCRELSDILRNGKRTGAFLVIYRVERAE